MIVFCHVLKIKELLMEWHTHTWIQGPNPKTYDEYDNLNMHVAWIIGIIKSLVCMHQWHTHTWIQRLKRKYKDIYI